MFRIEMLPAEYGDSLLVSWGKASAPRHLLIDGGLGKTTPLLERRLGQLGTPAPLELLVVTHIDNDHIKGMLELLKKKVPRVAPKEIWFNAWTQVKDYDDRAGVAQGNELMKRLDADWKEKWNTSFDRKAVVVPRKGALPTKRLDGGMKLTLLSPDGPKLGALAKEWRAVGVEELAEDRAAGKTKRKRLDKHSLDQLAQEPFKEDKTAPNGSSIAFILEFDGKRALLGADAHPGVLEASLKRAFPRERAHLDAFKLPHHGSEKNVSSSLLELVECPRFLVSTNGVQFEHPDDVALARVVRSAKDPTLFFNYASKRNRAWAKKALQAEFGFQAVFPPKGKSGLVIDL